MKSLPPIALDIFETEVEKKTDDKASANKSKSSSKSNSLNGSDEELSDTESEETVSPFDCLFCNQTFSTDSEGEDSGEAFLANLTHMQKSHNLSIPDPEMLTDIQSLITYLATEIKIWHECLYCGATKPSTKSIQSHMRDKNHCRLNFDREPELLEFWENTRFVEEDGAAELEKELSTMGLMEAERRGATGRVIGSKNAAATAKKAARKRTTAVSTTRPLPEGENSEETEVPPQQLAGPRLSSSRQLARRDEMSIIGLSVQQRQALVLAEKKAQRSEAMARRAREWVYAKGANSQKFDQLDNQMKWGKQNHKLLPR